MKTLDEIKGEMLLTPEERQEAIDAGIAKALGITYKKVGLTEKEYNAERVKYIGEAVSQAQHEKDMNTVISKSEMCPECNGMGFLVIGAGDHEANEPCPKCNGTGTVDITVRDAINKVGGDG